MNDNNMEALLKQRAQQGSEMPWLELRVMSQVEWREQARQWLKAHPGGLTVRRPLRLRLWSALSALAASRAWHVVGIALITLALGYLLMQLPAFSSRAELLQPWTLGTIAGSLVVAAVAAVNWPSLRRFYG